jgi:hypothetical protein
MSLGNRIQTKEEYDKLKEYENFIKVGRTDPNEATVINQWSEFEYVGE